MTPSDSTRSTPSNRLGRETTALRKQFHEPGLYRVVTPTGERVALFVVSRHPWRFARVEPRPVQHAEAADAAE